MGFPVLLAATVTSSPDLGTARAQCRANEPGPAFVVDVIGLKDRLGLLKLEVYPNNDKDFLQDDDVLVNAGRIFRRVEGPVPPSGAVTLCIRVPAQGPYSVSLLHDRDRNHKYSWTIDGIGFASNPRLGMSKPKAAATRAFAGPGITRIPILMNYKHGFGVAPLKAFRHR